MLEAGSVRSKNTTNILTKNFGDLCLGVVAFCLVGYGLAFSEGNEWVGNEYFGLINLPYSLYPHVFMQVSHTCLKDCDNMLSSGCLCCYVHDNSFGRNSREDGLRRLPNHQVCASVFWLVLNLEHPLFQAYCFQVLLWLAWSTLLLPTGHGLRVDG